MAKEVRSKYSKNSRKSIGREEKGVGREEIGEDR